ncbi:hypothetical protein TRIATDRAFT_299026 [Trichoderma atroviride IMI 206040]|uniref:Uncharacterized protein n=1 Tax=Hypocrea atroviridis (strain ATCC 20476 / IMI 206040) TaxID=452589 RepID=G9NSD1_HYPAI|nr:uncharacterized protein TRIATDRAFT_299026 [Trichoderma atroviride IMI 206040]EHK46332.1 hypothetical protein TRIATDRAFT_299026 [Trichoderma atroviride IMI 206040]
MSFSIQHPDLSSALVTPKGASTAEFQSVVCYVDVSPAKPSLKRKRNKATEDAGDTLLNAQRILEYFSQQTYRETRKPSRSAKPPKTESMKQLRQFLDIALELMVLGSRKQYKGITTNTCSWAECLTQLAPAVFSMQYLKVSPIF